MEIKRKIYSKLLEWKEKSNGKTALLIEGARRIGKSTIAEKFAKENYDSYIIIDFNIASDSIKDNFKENLKKLDIFFQNIMLEYNVKLTPRRSLIIFDEIQKFPIARQAIKYLVADGRFDYIETGSLISIKESVEDITIPSEEEVVRMYPVDFEEFVEFANESILLQYIRDCFERKLPLEKSYHNNAMRLFQEYILVGGMPQSVVAYFENHRDFSAADRAKRTILKMYKDDVKKANKKYKLKVAALFENIPGFLSTHEKKVTLSQISSNKSFQEFDESIYWLGDSMMCNLCYKCNDPNVGFSLTKNIAEVKCYMGDTGLLVSHTFSENQLASNELYKHIINGKLSINKGMFYENVIAQMIAASNKELYFYSQYSKEKGRNDIEIDFLITNEEKTNFKVIPLEVKSSKNYTSVSFEKFKKKFGKRVGISYIIHPKNLQEYENGYKIPPYMLFCLL